MDSPTENRDRASKKTGTVTLAEYLAEHPDPNALNLLQQNNIVSDNCISIEDVAIEDHARSIACLKNLKQDFF